jgi:HEPN domain-containing protein
MRPEPGTPTDWLRFARSDLAVALGPLDSDVRVETLCFHAQQAVEKCLKAVLLARSIAFPRTHNLRILIDLVPAATSIPPDIAASVALPDYAVDVRYPGVYEDITDEEYREALRLATSVVAWAETICIRDTPTGT